MIMAKIENRPYQTRIYTKTIDHIEKGGKSVLIESPTGSGKTIMGLSIAEYLQNVKGMTIGWSAMRRELLQQAQNENKEKGFNLDLNMISMFSKTPAKVDVLIVDEAQHDATTSMSFIHDTVKPKIIIGLSATPWRADRASLAFEKHIRDAGIGQLIRDGYLSHYHHFVLDKYDPKTVAECYASDPQKWGPSIIFFRERHECIEVVNRLDKAGIYAELVTADSDRERQTDDFKSGKVQVLVNMMILTEGFDAPMIKTVFVRPSSKGPSVQMAGRVFRKHKDHSFKQVVQCTKTKFPINKIAAPKEAYVEQNGEWKSLKSNTNIETEVNKSINMLLKTKSTYDPAKFMTGNKKRLRFERD